MKEEVRHHIHEHKKHRTTDQDIKGGQVWKDLMLFSSFHVWQTKQHKHWIVNKVKTLLSLGPLQISSGLLPLRFYLEQIQKSLSLVNYHPLTTRTYDQLNEDCLKIEWQPQHSHQSSHEHKLWGWTTVKKSDAFKNAHNIHIHTGEKKLKKYKNKLHKRSFATLLANFLGRFCKIFFCVCCKSQS